MKDSCQGTFEEHNDTALSVVHKFYKTVFQNDSSCCSFSQVI